MNWPAVLKWVWLAAYNIPNQKLSFMSLPRDTLVNVPWDIKKLNSVYSMYGGGDEGAAALFGEGANSRLEMENVSFITMPRVSADGVWSRTYNNHPSYVAPEANKMMEVVNENFNPYKTDLDKNELDVMYVNEDGTLGCTGGKLEDTEYNRWVMNK